MKVRFYILTILLLFIGIGSGCILEVKGSSWQTDTLPDGRHLWEMTEYERTIFYGDPMETEVERRWRLNQIREMGLNDLHLTASERLYLAGQKFSIALPSSKLASGATVVDDVISSGKHSAKQLIHLKNSAPQVGEVLGFAIQDSKIFISGRAVTHGRFDFVISKSGELNIGIGHYALSGGAREVLAAGQLKIYSGQITRISNWSGHYQPTIEQAMFFPDLLRNLGLTVSGAKFQLYSQQGKLVETIRLP